MDEGAFSTQRGRMNPLPCVFEKALLSQEAVCEASQRLFLAERDMIACREPVARAACGQLLTLLRSNAAFALKVRDAQRILPHAAMMKVQCGGLIGLKELLAPQAHAADVISLVRRAGAEYGDLEQLPFSRIVPAMARWRLRKRSTTQ